MGFTKRKIEKNCEPVYNTIRKVIIHNTIGSFNKAKLLIMSTYQHFYKNRLQRFNSCHGSKT